MFSSRSTKETRLSNFLFDSNFVANKFRFLPSWRGPCGQADRQTGRQTERQVGCFSRCLSSSFQLELSSADGPLLMAVRVSEVLQIATQTHTDAHSRTFIWATDNDRLAVCVLCSHLPPFSPRFFWPQLPSVLYPVSGSILHTFYICIPH